MIGQLVYYTGHEERISTRRARLRKSLENVHKMNFFQRLAIALRWGSPASEPPASADALPLTSSGQGASPTLDPLQGKPPQTPRAGSGAAGFGPCRSQAREGSAPPGNPPRMGAR